jgi:NAD(P)-dependent dehydrogenase (short-subunit alcohol dehydrogenase family)
MTALGDSHVLVVVGAGGVGLAAARKLGAARQVVLGDASTADLDAAVSSLRADGFNALGVQVDVSVGESVEAFVRSIDGPIGSVVHTAGVSPTMASTRKIYEVDLVGTAHIIDAFYRVATAGMSLVCVASMAGYFANLPDEVERHLATAPTHRLLDHDLIDLDAPDNSAAYINAKRGNILRVQAAAQAWGRKGARLNTVSPSVISTPMGQAEFDGPAGEVIRLMMEASGVRRLGTAEEVAAAIAFLAGPEAGFITGNDLLVDGGTISTQRWAAPNGC